MTSSQSVIRDSSRAAPPSTVRRRLDAWAAPAVALLYGVALAIFYPHSAFSLSPDEGFNAMKALLVDHHYRLNGQIWSDQPPLFTHLLRLWFTAFGADVGAGRLLVLVFAALLLFAVYDVVQRSWNHVAALAAVVLLGLSTYFARLSLSLMIGIPSLACAMLSLWALVRWYRQDAARRYWLLASAALMAASLSIKLFTAFLVPIFALWLTAAAALRGQRRPWQPALGWMLAVGALTTALVLILAGPTGLDQLFAPHLAAHSANEFEHWRGYEVLRRTAPLDAPLVILAALGTLLILSRRCWEMAMLPLWAGAALALLLPHVPFWYHHYLLLTTAAAPCAGVAVAAVLGTRRRIGAARDRAAPLALRVVGALALLLLALTVPMSVRTKPPIAVVEWDRARPILAAMQPYAGATTMVLTDSPIYAFQAGLPCVPELAVVSIKRMKTGNLLPANVLDALAGYAPEQVLLTDRFSAATVAALQTAMRDRYALVYSTATPPARLYIRSDVVQQAAQSNALTPGS